ncbi:MAG: hypothetical protein U0929_01685 [Planctomycetaceae bacterium]
MEKWFLKSGETETGPYLWSEIVFLHSRRKILDEDVLRTDSTKGWVAAGKLITPKSRRVTFPSAHVSAERPLETCHADADSIPASEGISSEESSRPQSPDSIQMKSSTALLSVALTLLLLIIMLLSLLTSHVDTGIGDGVTSPSSPVSGQLAANSKRAKSESPLKETMQQMQDSGDAFARNAQAILNESHAQSTPMATSPNQSNGNEQSPEFTEQALKSALKSDSNGNGKLSSGDDDGVATSQESSNSRFVIEPPGRTSLFGLSDIGRSFVYLIDCSSSMSGYDALNAAKAELITSISNLKSQHRFQIVFYNHAPMPLSSGGRWGAMFKGTKSDIEFVRKQIQSVPPDGGTDHLQALIKGLSYKPDVLFLLTDATEPGLSKAQLNDVKRSNRSSARIHCIEFGVGPELSLGEESLSQSFMKTLSAETGGRYAYRDVTQLQHSQP